MDKSSRHALIIGGGIAGLATASFLRRAGVSCQIYEAYPRLTHIGGGLQVFPNGMRVLGELGLAEDALRAGALMTQTRFRNRRGGVLSQVSMGAAEDYGQPAITIRRASLHQLLADAVEHQGMRVEYGKKLSGIAESATEITAKFSDGTSASGSFLVGADGIHSRVRQYIMPGEPGPLYSNLIGFLSFVPARALKREWLPGTYMDVTLGPVGFFGHCLADTEEDGQASVMWWSYLSQERQMSREELSSVPTEEIQARLLKAHAGWHEPIGTLIRESTSICRIGISDLCHLRTWHSGRALILGDAAHAMNPISGQGASTALEDAIIFASFLNTHSGEPAEVFERFERARRDRVEKITLRGRKSGERSRRQFGPVAAWLRDRALSVLPPLTAPRWSDWLYGYDFSGGEG